MKKYICAFLIAVFALLMVPGCGIVSFGDKSGAEVKDGKIELDSASVDFGRNRVADGKSAIMSETKAGITETEDGLCSALYTITIEEQLDKPVSVSLPVPEDFRTNSDIVLRIGVGVECVYDNGENEIQYFFYDAKVDDGMATASFVPKEVYDAPLYKSVEKGTGMPAQPVGGKIKFNCGLFESCCYFENGGHFKLYYPTKVNGRDFELLTGGVRPILSDLEATYVKFKDMGYKYNDDDFPMNIEIKSISQDGAYSSLFKNIELKTGLFQGEYTTGKLNSLIWHEFFHYVQGCYTGMFGDTDWIDEATASYFEASARGETYTGLMQQYYEKTFSGPIPASENAQEGYARSAMIAYLCEKLGNNEWIRTVYENGGSTEAFISAVGDPAEWAHNYYTYLGCGGGFDSTYSMHKNIADKISGTDIGQVLALAVPSEEDQQKMIEDEGCVVLGQTSLSMPGLGCRMVAITISEEELKKLPDSSVPQVSCIGGEVTLLSAIGKQVQLEGTSMSELSRVLDKNKKIFLAVVTSDADRGKNSTVELKVTLPGMDINGVDSFMGLWYSPSGGRKLLTRYGDLVVEKEPDLSWYDGDICVTEYRVEYDPSNYTLILRGTTSWIGAEGTLYDPPEDPDDRFLEIDATPLTFTITALKAENGTVIEMKTGTLLKADDGTDYVMTNGTVYTR